MALVNLSHSADSPWYLSPIGKESLRYLTIYFAIQTGIVTLSVAAFFMAWDFELPSRLVLFSLPAQFMATLITYRFSLKMDVVKTWHYLGMLILSVLMLSCFLHDSGGYTNPLISLLLVPVAMSAAMLAWQASVVLSVLVIVLYAGLMRFYVPLGPELVAGHHHNAQMMQLHLFGMWVTFCLSIILLLVLVIPLAASVRKQRETIAQQREQSLQDERIVAMATFAASAAHQLGTPLSTLSILTEDLAEEFKKNESVQQDLSVMAEQIEHCKTTLHSMMKRADSIRNNEQQNISVDQLLKNLRSQFNLLNPAYSLTLNADNKEHLMIKSDETLEQALLNLLDNAARASKNNPMIDVEVKDKELCFKIIDTGPGIDEALQQNIGQPYVTTRDNKEGMGLGLFLSNSTINRLGGRLKLTPSPKGTVTEVWLPLSRPERIVNEQSS